MDIKTAFQLAEQEKSKIPHEYINRLTGLSSPKIWHLLNNLCADADIFMEIGSYMGSSLLASIYEHDIKAIAIDNFCMKPTTRNHFFQNIKHLKNLEFIEADCFKIDPAKIQNVNVYLFDGRHEYEDQYKALTHFITSMSDEFIFVCDDFNNEPVQRATFDAIRDLNLTIIEQEKRTGNYSKDKTGWWCGIFVARLKKPTKDAISNF